MFKKINDYFIENPFIFYCVGMAVVLVIAYATDLNCNESPVTCMMLVMK